VTEKAWKPLELVKVSADYLASKEVRQARLDAELLLCDIMGLERRVDLYAGFEREISGKELTQYRELIKRRAAREPVSRILGRREFMGLAFAVTPEVLSPRPETELLVEAAVEVVRPKKAAFPADETAGAEPAADAPEEADGESPEMAAHLAMLLDSYAEDSDDPDGENEIALSPGVPVRGAVRRAPPPEPKRSAAKAETAPRDRVRILDLGTGSGCIAVSLAALLPEAVVLAVDASPGALAVARGNAKNAGVAERIAFRRGDWFAGCRDGEKFDVIVSNPPYLVKEDPEIWPEVALYDPPMSLYGGSDGLDCYRRIIPDLGNWLAEGGTVLLEVGDGQAGRVAEMLANAGFSEVSKIRDYGGVERVVKAGGMCE